MKVQMAALHTYRDTVTGIARQYQAENSPCDSLQSKQTGSAGGMFLSKALALYCGEVLVNQTGFYCTSISWVGRSYHVI
jgi:hypothetical protein